MGKPKHSKRFKRCPRCGFKSVDETGFCRARIAPYKGRGCNDNKHKYQDRKKK